MGEIQNSFLTEHHEPSGSIVSVLELLRQKVSPDTYRSQLDHLNQSAELKTGFEQEKLPHCERVYFFGDIHARPTQVASALEKIDESCKKRGSSIEHELADGKIAIVILGDLVHAEKNLGNYQMASTPTDRQKLAQENLNTVIGIATLKNMFPKSVFVVQGNHDALATHSGVAKFGIDQGEVLGDVLKKQQLDKKFQRVLDNLPLMIGLHIGDKHIVASHAVPVFDGDYAEILRFIGNPTLPINGTNESILVNINGIWGDPKHFEKRTTIDLDEVRTLARDKIASRDPEVARLLTWGKVQDPRAGPGQALRLGEKVRLNSDVLDTKAQIFLDNYLYTLCRILFAKTKTGENIYPKDIVWIFGHEQQYEGFRNVLDSIDSQRLNNSGLKMLQINLPSALPVFGIHINKWGKNDFFDKANLLKVK